ncbi:MAG: thiol:disulfide interchange protein DsbA/DsbL, partial [Gammaproteobacteria bacterium]|nr:thiol:disulfide interchange protein DsbA/DsbL [Gammaproteobacteria bacterium]
LTWMTVQDAPLGEFVEGEHYQLIDNPRRIRSDKIEVMEFFSYACVHCFNLDPNLTDWVEEQGDNVEFIRIPAVASEYWRLLGRAYYTLEQIDAIGAHHMTLFRAIHQSRQTFPTPESLFDYAQDAGIDRELFESTYKSTPVNSALNRADQMSRRLKVASVPTIVIQGKYIVRTTRAVGPTRMLEVMDYLVEKERTATNTDSEK